MKEFLSKKGISFEERNVAEDSSAREEMIAKIKSTAVPTSIIKGEVVIGFDKSKIDKLLH